MRTLLTKVLLVSFLFLAIGADGAVQKPSFLIQPYLFAANSLRMQLGWQYAGELPAGQVPRVLVFGEGQRPREVPVFPANPSAGGASGYPGRLWFAHLPFPVCGSSLHLGYQVWGMEHPQAISMPPCPDEPVTARFSFIADAQQHPQFVQTLSVGIGQFPGAALLSGGDLVHHGAIFSDWVDYFGALSGVAGSRLMLPAIGNHEYRSTRETNLWQQFFQTPAAQAHTSYYLGSVHVIILNSCFEDDPSLVESQIPWLVKQLGMPAAWKVVMFHHPPYSRSIANLTFAPKKEWLHLQKHYVPLFEAFGVDVVLAGHTHIFERSLRNGIQYLTAGPAGGVMGHLAANNPYSLLVEKQRTVTHFEATPNEFSAVTLNIQGGRIDSFRLHKEGAQ